MAEPNLDDIGYEVDGATATMVRDIPKPGIAAYRLRAQMGGAR